MYTFDRALKWALEFSYLSYLHNCMGIENQFAASAACFAAVGVVKQCYVYHCILVGR